MNMTIIIRRKINNMKLNTNNMKIKQQQLKNWKNMKTK